MKSKQRPYIGQALPSSDKTDTDCRAARGWIEDANFGTVGKVRVRPSTRKANASPRDGTPNRAYHKAHPEFYCGPMAQTIDRKKDGSIRPRLVKQGAVT